MLTIDNLLGNPRRYDLMVLVTHKLFIVNIINSSINGIKRRNSNARIENVNEKK